MLREVDRAVLYRRGSPGPVPGDGVALRSPSPPGLVCDHDIKMMRTVQMAMHPRTLLLLWRPDLTHVLIGFPCAPDQVQLPCFPSCERCLSGVRRETRARAMWSSLPAIDARNPDRDRPSIYDLLAFIRPENKGLRSSGLLRLYLLRRVSMWVFPDGVWVVYVSGQILYGLFQLLQGTAYRCFGESEPVAKDVCDVGT